MFRDDSKIKNMYDMEYKYYILLNDVADNSIKDGLIDFKKIPEDRVGYNFEKCGENVKIIYYIKDFETIYNINVDLNTTTNSYEKKCSFEVSDYNEYKVQYISGIEKIVKIVLIVILFFIMFIIICKYNYIFI